jgi:hypothetical protein
MALNGNGDHLRAHAGSVRVSLALLLAGVLSCGGKSGQVPSPDAALPEGGAEGPVPVDKPPTADASADTSSEDAVDAGSDLTLDADASTDQTSVDGTDIKVDPCRAARVNVDQAHAESYQLGTTIQGCSPSRTGAFHQFTTPAGSTGGSVVVTVISTAAFSDPLTVVAFRGGDTIKLLSVDAAFASAPINLWFTAAPSTRYDLQVMDQFRAGQNAPTYSLTASFAPVEDSFEPNESKAAASRLTVGQPVQALMFAGASRNRQITEWWDFYTLEAKDGPTTVTLTGVPAELTLSVYLYDSGMLVNNIRGFGESPAPGGDISFTTQPLTAGTHFLQVEPSPFAPYACGPGTTLPSYTTQRYTLTVKQ